MYEKNNKRYLDVDYVQWLTGQSAVKAMIEDGLCKGQNENDCFPCSEFYIRNPSTKVETVEINSDVSFTMATLSHNPDGNFNSGEKITYERLRSVFEDRRPVSVINAPYHIEIGSQGVISIWEQYLP